MLIATDRGLNWVPANVDSGTFSYFPIKQIRFSNKQYGFAVGGIVDLAGVVWCTVDSGKFWKSYAFAPHRFDDF